MKEYRIVCKSTGREVAKVKVPMRSYVNNLTTYVLKYAVEYCDTDGMLRVEGNNYTADDLMVTDIDLLFEEKVRLLKDCGLSEFDAKNYIRSDMVIFYNNNILGFNNYKSNMTDLEHAEIEKEWESLAQVDRINDSGYVIGSYRVEFFS